MSDFHLSEDEQRAWLQGFVAGLASAERMRWKHMPLAAAESSGETAPEPKAQPDLAPLQARFASRTLLTTAAADRDTYHVVLDLAGSGLRYEAGDALAIWPRNNPDEVELIVAILRARGSEQITMRDGVTLAAREALAGAFDLRTPTSALYRLLAQEAADAADGYQLARLAEDPSRASTLGVEDVLDALLEFPSARPPIGELAAALAPIEPRTYSIASSPRRHPGEAHLTVSMLRYDANERSYQGAASSYLCEQLRPDRRLGVAVDRARTLRLPEDHAAPIVMIGPGTGIAPFRAFLEEREATWSPGRNWLFVGNQRHDGDFLYRDELEEFATRRVLTRMDLAFARDQANKVYVQHRLLAAAQELWRWLGNGAHVYVCGDGRRMAEDVDLALRQIAANQGGMDAAGAAKYFTDLSRNGRYQRVLY